MARTIESAVPGPEPADSARNANDRQACSASGPASTARGPRRPEPSGALAGGRTPRANAAARYPCDRPSMTSWRRALVRVRAASGRRGDIRTSFENAVAQGRRLPLPLPAP